MSIVLPPMSAEGVVTVEQALRARRSHREFSATPISREALAVLLWAAGGVTGADGARAAPSAGGHYPLQGYVAAGAVADLPQGVYEYRPGQHALEPFSTADVRGELGEAALGEQPWVETAAAVIVILADLDGARARFHSQPPLGVRGDRYVYMEAGALAENVHLQATALGLGMVLVGGFDDSAVLAALRLDEPLQPVAMLCLGEV